MAKRKSYAKTWLEDFWNIALNEFKQIFSDGGVMLIFFVAGLIYPLLYNVVYLNGVLSDTPIAVVDEAGCAESRRYIRELDATREVEVAYKCVNMAEAQQLMKDRKVNGIVLFPRDFGDKVARMETAILSVYCDMSCFLYYKNVLMSTNYVMLHEIGQIQVERYAEAGFTGIEAEQLVEPIPYEENNPYNRAFSYSIFLLSVILFIIIQQTMFYGMSLLVGTQREENRSFASLPYHLHGRGMGRVVLGRGFAYWTLYMIISIYIAMIVPAIFGVPQRGNFWDILILLIFFVTACVYFSMAFSTLITRRESVFMLFLVISPICILLTGTSWPSISIPGFWKAFAALFPSTYGCQAYVNMSTAGGDLAAAHDQIIALTIQIVIYFFLSTVAVYAENWIVRHKAGIKARKERIEKEMGIDYNEKDRLIISGEAGE